MKKFVSLLLILATFTGMFTGCVRTAKDKYMTKGEFFSLLISEMNYYPISYSAEEMENAKNYKIEAQTMVDWELLPEEMATKRINASIEKETVLLACINSMKFVSAGDTENIEDINLCDYPQEMANAVASGLVELDHGYINAKEKMTKTQCEEILNNAMNADINGHFENGGEKKYSDNVAAFFEDSLNEEDMQNFTVSGYEEAEAREFTNPEDVDCVSKPVVGFATYSNNNAVIEDIATENTEFIVNVPENVYVNILNKPDVGKTVIYEALPFTTGNYTSKSVGSFAGVIKKIEVIPSLSDFIQTIYVLTLTKISDEEILSLKETKEVNEKVSKNAETELLSVKDEDSGFSFSVTKDSSGGIKVTAEKDLEINYGNKGNYQDQKETPHIKVSAKISDINVDMNNTQILFNKFKKPSKNQESFIKLSYKLTKSFELTSSARLAPDNNGNGGFISNLKRSRFTSGQGANNIKIAKINIPIGQTGFKAELYFYLHIELDGSISITVSQGSSLIISKESNGNIRAYTQKDDDEKKEVELKTKLTVELNIELSLYFVAFNICAASYAVIPKAEISASVKYYYNNESKGNDEGSCDLDLIRGCKSDPNFGYELNASLKITIRGELCEKNFHNDTSVLYKIMKWLGKESSLNTKEKTLYEKSFHEEWPEKSDSEKETLDEQAKSEQKFLVENFKVIMIDGTCTINKLGSPISDKKIENTYSNGIQIKVKDSNIVDAVYDKEHHVILLTTKGCGSTEVEVFVQKDKTKDKKYSQTFSVTVQENRDMEI